MVDIAVYVFIVDVKHTLIQTPNMSNFMIYSILYGVFYLFRIV